MSPLKVTTKSVTIYLNNNESMRVIHEFKTETGKEFRDAGLTLIGRREDGGDIIGIRNDNGHITIKNLRAKDGRRQGVILPDGTTVQAVTDAEVPKQFNGGGKESKG